MPGNPIIPVALYVAWSVLLATLLDTAHVSNGALGSFGLVMLLAWVVPLPPVWDRLGRWGEAIGWACYRSGIGLRHQVDRWRDPQMAASEDLAAAADTLARVVLHDRYCGSCNRVGQR